MGDKTGISWTTSTWNPLRGCSRVSEGCRNCYAETVAARFSGPGQPYEGVADKSRSGSKWTGEVKLIEHMLDQPLRWNRQRRIFVNSMSDLFHESVPDEWVDQIFAIMAAAHWHQFQVLTKRPERMKKYFEDEHRVAQRWIDASFKMVGSMPSLKRVGWTWAQEDMPWPLPNVWMGVSVENQETADKRIPLLLDTPAAVRFISAEPLLGPVDLRHIDQDHDCYFNALSSSIGPNLDWVIVGGESGLGARPMHPDWARKLRDQCAEASVPYFFKQWGEHIHEVPVSVERDPDIYISTDGIATTDEKICAQSGPWAGMWRLGKSKTGDFLDNVQHHEFPQAA